MKIKMSLAELSAAWGVLTTAVPQRSPRPVLSNIKIRSAEQVELSATDLDIGIRYVFEEAQIEDQGEILVNAEKMSRILRENPSDSIEMEGTENGTRLSYGSDEFHLPGEDPSHFPASPEFKGKKMFEIDKGVFQTLIRQTAFSAAHEETRYALNGVLLELSGTEFKAVATDGKRLTLARTKCKGGKGMEFKALVPLKGIQALDKILSLDDVSIELGADDGNLYAKTKRAEVICRLLEGNFPEYEEVIPKGYENRVKLNRQVLASKLRLADAFTTEETKAVKMHFEKGNLTITAQGPESGEARVVMAVEYEGAPMDIAFNPQYFLDGMKVLTDESVLLEIQDANASAKLTAGEAFTYVIMPLSLD